jgi:hypothetical protein
VDIIATDDGKFAVSLGFRSFECDWSKKDGSLSVWAKKGEKTSFAHVRTGHGTFVEAVDDKGNVVMDGGDANWFYVPLSKKPVTLRVKKLPDPKLSKAQLDKERQKVTRYLVADRPYSLDLPDTLTGMIGWMEKQLRAVPEKARKAARFEFTTDYSYGESYPQIEIKYDEPESDKEVVKRVQIERERARIAEACERAKLQNLKTKYENA